jgi:RNA polymerase sigma factor FliA
MLAESTANDALVTDRALPGRETTERRVPGARPERLTRAQSDLVKRNLPLVEHIVTRMTSRFPSNYSRDDLVQTGNLGLIEASTRFDPGMGVAFSTFAGRRIEGAVIDMLRRDDWAPRSVRALERRVETMEQALTSAGREMPDAGELGVALGISVDALRRLRADVNRAAVDSLDRAASPIDSHRGLGENLADFVTPLAEEQLDVRELKGFLRDAIGLLPERHRVVVLGYFFQGCSMTELGELLGITQSRASQIKEEALSTIRAALRAQYDENPVETEGLKARRQAAFNEAVARASSWRERLEDRPMAVGA